MESPPVLPSLPSPNSLPIKAPSRTQLVSTLLPVCLRLKRIVSELDDIAIKVSDGRINDEVLYHLRTETFPTICAVDVDLKETSKWISSQIDRSRVSDPCLQVLIDFFKYTKEMIRVIEDVSSIVYEDLDRVMEERQRGLLMTSLSHTTLYSLKQMRVGLNRAVNLINSRTHA